MNFRWLLTMEDFCLTKPNKSCWKQLSNPQIPCSNTRSEASCQSKHLSWHWGNCLFGETGQHMTRNCNMENGNWVRDPSECKIRKRDSSLHDSMPGFKENRCVSLKNKKQEPATFFEENQDFLQNHLQFLFILKQNFLWGPGLIHVEKQSIHLKDEPENTKI